jgi:hypothetical protein
MKEPTNSYTARQWFLFVVFGIAIAVMLLLYALNSGLIPE